MAVDKSSTIGKWQLKNYTDLELPNLNKVIDEAAASYGSITEFLKAGNERLKQWNFPPISSNEISTWKRNESSKVRRDGISERTLFRLAIALDIDPDPLWGCLLLRLYLLGKIASLNISTVALIKEAAQITGSQELGNFDFLRWIDSAEKSEIRDAIIAAAKKLAPEGGEEATRLEDLVVGIVANAGASEPDIFIQTALTESRWEAIRTGATPEHYELASLAAWLTEISGEEWSADGLAARIEAKKSFKP